MTGIAQLSLDLAGGSGKVSVRLLAPEKLEDGPGWRCKFEIGEPIDYARYIYGETSFQALVLALKILSVELYSSDEYKEGRLGIDGEFRGYLGLPASKEVLDRAPYPF